MTKHPPEVYAAGELDKVRRNLGDVTPEEAKRIASLLGGRVGVEKSPQIAKKSYQKTSRKVSAGADSQTESGRSGEKIPVKHAVSDGPPEPLRIVRVSYLDKIRKNFLASRKEYRLKPFIDSILSLFPFLHLPDTIHPRFIMESRKQLMEPLEEFVFSVRKIFSMKNEDFMRAVSKNDFYLKIIRTICAWDAENIHKELSKLRLQPERVTFSDCERMVQSLYKPYFILRNVSVEEHIRTALEFCLECHVILSPVEFRAELKTIADTACSLLPRIFYGLRQNCYPILLKNLPTGFYEYADFFDEMPEEALFHLNLTQENILKPEEQVVASQRETPERGTEEPAGEQKATALSSDGKTGSEETAGTDSPGEVVNEALAQGEGALKHAVIPPPARKGMENLDRLFPDHGLLNMEKRPDLYALLQKEFQPLPGLDLVPPEDPLIQIILPAPGAERTFLRLQGHRIRIVDRYRKRDDRRYSGTDSRHLAVLHRGNHRKTVFSVPDRDPAAVGTKSGISQIGIRPEASRRSEVVKTALSASVPGNRVGGGNQTGNENTRCSSALGNPFIPENDPDEYDVGHRTDREYPARAGRTAFRRVQLYDDSQSVEQVRNSRLRTPFQPVFQNSW